MSEVNKNYNTGDSAVKRIKTRNMLKRQRIAVALMICAVILLAVALIAVNYIVDIYVYEDLDGSEYYIKKINGIYKLCYKDGEVLPTNSEGYYRTDEGNLVQINSATGEWSRYAVVDTAYTEQKYYSTYVLMYKAMTYDAMSTKDESAVIGSIEVHNAHGSYTFERTEGNNFSLSGHDGIQYDFEKFASLAVVCGEPLASRRLEEPVRLSDGSIDLSEYGLTAEKRTVTELDENGNEIVTEYDYEPAYFVVTTMAGDVHRVIIGDKTVPGTGRYALYDGGVVIGEDGVQEVYDRRDTVYILGNTTNPLGYSGIEDVLLSRVEDMITPMIVYPSEMSDHFNVSDFIIYDNIDYDAIYDALVERFGDPEEIEDGSVDEEEFLSFYNETFEKYSHKACHFSYQELNSRNGAMNAHEPYVSHLDYAGGYYVNGSSIDTVLYNLYDTVFTGVEVLSPTEEDIAEYGLDRAAFVISYFYGITLENGEKSYVHNYVEVSERQENGVYYAYSSDYDMIVGVDESSFDFLDWEEIAWYDTGYIQLNISNVTDVKIESPEFSVHYEIEDSASKYTTYLEQTGDAFADGGINYSIKKDSQGIYRLKRENEFLSPVYSGDYLITPLVYTEGVEQPGGYIFAETSGVDLDGDGEDDGMAYYYYQIINYQGKYCLAAKIAIADNAGNLIDSRTVLGEAYHTTEYFVTNNGYLYLVEGDSYTGKELDRLYTSANRGRWGKGELFVTSDESFVLVNTETGEWSIIDDISCGIYFGDKRTSRLSQRAVEIPAQYDASGKIKRHAEIFYPTTDEKLQYDEESGGIQVYNTDRKSWEKATYSDCTIGVWNKGSYYRLDSGRLVIVNEETGDWGIVTVATFTSYIAEIIADGEILDYTVRTTNHAGKVRNSSAMDNFKQFYAALLYASIEGMAEIDESEKAALRALDDFETDSAENPCQLKITINAEDIYGNRRDTVYRFYRYSERKSYITIEALSSPDAPSDPEKAYGNFYVLQSFVDKIIEDAKRIYNGEEVTSVTKY